MCNSSMNLSFSSERYRLTWASSVDVNANILLPLVFVLRYKGPDYVKVAVFKGFGSVKHNYVREPTNDPSI
jgi:hypothetical protein